MDLPESKSVDKEYLPPVEERSSNDIAVGDFAPFAARSNDVDDIAAEEITTIEPEDV